jgi:hypothetical protein
LALVSASRAALSLIACRMRGVRRASGPLKVLREVTSSPHLGRALIKATRLAGQAFGRRPSQPAAHFVIGPASKPFTTGDIREMKKAAN